MSDENKIQLEIELSESSIDTQFDLLDERAKKSAETSAAVFEQEFKQQEEELQRSVDRIINETKKTAQKSAKESAQAFNEAFQKQDAVYKASQKQNIDNAIGALTGSGQLKKSAQESASVFEEAFAKEAKTFDPINLPISLGGGGLGGLATKLGAVTAGLFALKKAGEAAFDSIVAGEDKIKSNKTFEILAESAGVAANVLKDDLSKAARGIIDDDAIIKLASGTFLQLGNNAKALPQILELAQKTYKVFGGTVLQNTEAINTAIFSGNTRQLKALGILIDAEAVYKNYAKAIGTVPALLSQNEKQTAILNAVLDQGAKKFKNISIEVDNLKDATEKVKVSFGSLVGEFQKNEARNAGGFFKAAALAASDFFDTFTRGLQQLRGPQTLDEAKVKIEQVTLKLAEARKAFDSFKISEEGLAGPGLKAALDTKVKDLESTLSRLKSFAADQREVQKLLDQRAAPTAKAAPDAGVEAETIRRRQELVAKVQGINDQLNQSEVALAQAQFEREKTRANFEKLTYEQRRAEAEKFQIDVATLEKFYTDNGINDAALKQQGREAQLAAHNNRLLAIDQNYNQQKKSLFDKATTETLSAGQAFNNVALGMREAAQELAVDASKNFKNVGKAMLTSVGGAAGNAFAAFGAAIATGENALEAFGKSLLNSLGQAAIQMGTTFILQGIAYTYAGLANGPPLIAAGAALAAAGGLLSASLGAGGASASTGGGTAGGLDNANPINSDISPADTKPETPKTEVNLTINGNVLDRRETGLELAQILEEQFADQGLSIRGAV